MRLDENSKLLSKGSDLDEQYEKLDKDFDIEGLEDQYNLLKNQIQRIENNIAQEQFVNIL